MLLPRTCRIPDCPGFDSSDRRCAICRYVSHHLCSNEMLHSLDLEVEQQYTFCSRECHQRFIRTSGDLNDDEPDDEPEDDPDDGPETSGLPATTPNINLPKGRIRRNTYTIKNKIACIRALERGEALRELARKIKIGHTVIHGWKKKKRQIVAWTSSKKLKNLAGGGRKPDIPDQHSLITFMKDTRREGLPLTSVQMIHYLKTHHQEWLTGYLQDPRKKNSKTAYNALLRMLQRFCHRHGFSRQRTTRAKKKIKDLEETRREFSTWFHDGFGEIASDNLYNCDETGFNLIKYTSSFFI